MEWLLLFGGGLNKTASAVSCRDGTVGIVNADADIVFYSFKKGTSVSLSKPADSNSNFH